MKVYAVNVKNIDCGKLYGSLSSYRQDKVNRLRTNAHKAQSIGAEAVLNYAVQAETGVFPEYEIDSNGKPFLTNIEGVYFNLSHSGDYAVCAVHDTPIGVDIQKIKNFNMRTAERFFCSDETAYIKAANNPETAFFEIWTKKESFVKAVGQGLRMSLSVFSVIGNEIEYDNKIYKFKRFSLSKPDYMLFVCYEA